MNSNSFEKQKEYIEKIKKEVDGKSLLYCIYTMGCQLNENDSEKISGMIEDMGYIKTDNLQDANLIVFNTCCIRENAEFKLFGKLGEVKLAKKNNNAIVCVCGCMVQEEHIVEKIRKSYKHVDIMFGTHTLQNFPTVLYNQITKKEKIEDIIDIDGKVYEGIPIKRFNSKKASVTIMYGCNNFCTYCIVPTVRGRERSRNPEDILKEVEDLARSGYKEVTLLGQNVNSYMKVKNKELESSKSDIDSFAKLLCAINSIDGIERIRFVSPHPKDFTLDVINAIKDGEKICKSIHLPIQSGSNRVLKAMNRGYTREGYLELVKNMQDAIPNLALSTDIIVGFPGETEDDFLETLDIINKVSFDQVYMFIYSPRVGTPAEKMDNQVDEDIKHERLSRLKVLVDSQLETINEKYIGTIQKVFVEGISKNNDDFLSGRTDSNKTVIFAGDKELIGNIINIKILSEHMWYLKGDIV